MLTETQGPGCSLARSRRWLRNVAVLLLLPVLSALAVTPAYAGLSTWPSPGLPGASPGGFPRITRQIGTAVALTRAGSAELAFVGAPRGNTSRGIVLVYTRRGSSFRHTATIGDPAGRGAEFGSAIAASGPWVAILGNAKVFVYHQLGAKWQQQAVLAGPAGNDASQLAMSGSTLIVGNDVNAAMIYSRAGGAWSLQATVSQPNVTFGSTISVSGSTAVFGGYNAAWVYVRSGSHWVKQATLTAFGKYFGNAVAISGSTIVVGAWGAYRHYVGLAYIYQRSGRAWRRVARFKDPNNTRLGAFGDSVAISGRRALVGAPSPFYPTPGMTPRCGSAYEFVKSAGRWRYRAKLANPGCTSGDEFSLAMAVLGKTALVGAPTKNHNHGGVYEITLP